ncbi:MAG: hypothetical protein ACRCZP_20520, partial [Phycicoccus sp.]
DDNAFAGGRETHLPPPRLGEHTSSVLAWLDETDAVLDATDAARHPVDAVPSAADAVPNLIDDTDS